MVCEVESPLGAGGLTEEGRRWDDEIGVCSEKGVGTDDRIDRASGEV